jgi:hypothetical protein
VRTLLSFPSFGPFAGLSDRNQEDANLRALAPLLSLIKLVGRISPRETSKPERRAVQ